MTLVPVPVSATALKVATEFLERFGGIAGFVESVLSVPKGYAEHWHQQNLISWYDKLQEENARRQSEGRRPIPPNLLMPALQQIAMEDDDDMLTMWARLFANFQDPAQRVTPNKLYVHILSEMQPLDARLLHHIVFRIPDQQRIVFGPDEIAVGIMFSSAEDLAKDIGVDEAGLLLSIHNLNRLGCLMVRPWDPTEVRWTNTREPPLPGIQQIPQVPTIITGDGTFYLNSLGVDLVEACGAGP
jgi:hypothetical protein